MTTEARNVWGEAITCLEEHYKESTFFAERDVAWTVQCFLSEKLRDCGLPGSSMTTLSCRPKRATGPVATKLIVV